MCKQSWNGQVKTSAWTLCSCASAPKALAYLKFVPNDWFHHVNKNIKRTNDRHGFLRHNYIISYLTHVHLHSHSSPALTHTHGFVSPKLPTQPTSEQTGHVRPCTQNHLTSTTKIRSPFWGRNTHSPLAACFVSGLEKSWQYLSYPQLPAFEKPMNVLQISICFYCTKVRQQVVRPRDPWFIAATLTLPPPRPWNQFCCHKCAAK